MCNLQYIYILPCEEKVYTCGLKIFCKKVQENQGVRSSLEGALNGASARIVGRRCKNATGAV